MHCRHDERKRLDSGAAAIHRPSHGNSDYQVNPARADRFYSAIRSYWPDLPDGSLQAAYSGIRPKISAPGEPACDFMISSQREHGVPGLINLFGIESPGLTSCLAIARRVRELIER